MMKHLLALLALSGLLLGGCSEPPYTNIDNAQLKSLVEQGVPLYDVRRPDEWRQSGVVAGSRKLTFVDASGRPIRNSCRASPPRSTKMRPWF